MYFWLEITYCLLRIVSACLVLLKTCSQDKKSEYYSIVKYLVTFMVDTKYEVNYYNLIIHTASQPQTSCSYINLLSSETRQQNPLCLNAFKPDLSPTSQQCSRAQDLDYELKDRNGKEHEKKTKSNWNIMEKESYRNIYRRKKRMLLRRVIFTNLLLICQDFNKNWKLDPQKFNLSVCTCKLIIDFHFLDL